MNAASLYQIRPWSVSLGLWWDTSGPFSRQSVVTGAVVLEVVYLSMFGLWRVACDLRLKSRSQILQEGSLLKEKSTFLSLQQPANSEFPHILIFTPQKYCAGSRVWGSLYSFFWSLTFLHHPCVLHYFLQKVSINVPFLFRVGFFSLFFVPSWPSLVLLYSLSTFQSVPWWDAIPSYF